MCDAGLITRLYGERLSTVGWISGQGWFIIKLVEQRTVMECLELYEHGTDSRRRCAYSQTLTLH